MAVKSKCRAKGSSHPTQGSASWALCAATILPACLAVIAPQPTAAQAAPQAPTQLAANGTGTSTIENVVVTAERRSSNIQTTPLAITSVAAATLDKTFSNQISDLNATVPSLEITKASGFENLVTIRGVGSETPENSLTTSPGVSEFIDGVYIANTISLDQTLFDIDRIEVLRGPQGALYGTSSDGGAISIVTKQPELGHLGGNADFSAGNYNLFRERAEVNIPVGDTLAIRISGQKYDHDGFGTDTILKGNDLDDAHDQSVKAAVLWKPIPDFTATLTGMWYAADQNGAEQKNVLDPQTDPRKFEQDYPSEFNLRTELYHLNLEYDTDWFNIKSVSAYQGLNHQQQEDSSRGAVQWLGIYDDIAAWNTKMKNLNEEFDLVSKPGSVVDWVAGAFVLNQSSHQYVAEFECTSKPCASPTQSQLSIAPNIEADPPGNLDYGNDSSVTRRSYAAFAQATYHFLPQLSATIGGRYNYDYYGQRSHNFSAFDVDTVRNSFIDHVPTYRFELDYTPATDNLLYASVARGYKPGGTNGIYGQLVIPETFVPETNTSFEIGSKNLFLNHALRINLAAYYSIYKNMQYIENDPIPFDGGIANIPTVHAYGIEAETTYVALDDRLRLNANIALENANVVGNYKTIDSTVQNAIENQPFPSPCAFGGIYYNPACGAAVIASALNIKGKNPPAMPKQSGSVSVAYTFDVPYGTFTPRAEFIFRGSEWERVFNDPTLDHINSYGVVDLNFLYVPNRGNWTAQLTATNIGNVNGIDSKYTDPYGTGQTSVEYIPPFQIIGSVSYKF